MPTYAYRCEHCYIEFDKFQGITASPLRKCPECGQLKLRRLIGTGAGIIFKGSGFYQTDYRSDSYKDAAKKDKPETATKDKTKKDKGSTDTKATQTESTTASTSSTSTTEKKKTA